MQCYANTVFLVLHSSNPPKSQRHIVGIKNRARMYKNQNIHQLQDDMHNAEEIERTECTIDGNSKLGNS